MSPVDSTARRKSLKRWLWALGALACAVIVCGASLALWIVKQETHYVTGEPLQPIIPTTPMEIPPTATPPTESPPSLPHDFVAQAMPTSFEVICGDAPLISTSQVTTTVRRTVGIRNGNRVINLAVPGDTVAVVNDTLAPWADLPGSDAQTVSIAGHANYPQRMAFNPIAEYQGDTDDCQAVVTVPGGVLTYEFVQPHTAPKAVWLSELASLSGVKGRLLVATCSTADDTTIWEFTLVSSKAA